MSPTPTRLATARRQEKRTLGRAVMATGARDRMWPADSVRRMVFWITVRASFLLGRLLSPIPATGSYLAPVLRGVVLIRQPALGLRLELEGGGLRPVSGCDIGVYASPPVSPFP